MAQSQGIWLLSLCLLKNYHYEATKEGSAPAADILGKNSLCWTAVAVRKEDAAEGEPVRGAVLPGQSQLQLDVFS